MSRHLRRRHLTVGLLWLNGAGKSALLRIMACVNIPGGHLLIFDKIPAASISLMPMCAAFQSIPPVTREGFVPVGKASLYYREIGQGQPILILHGGPDFDHAYLLPDMDRLSDRFRMIYYDQRGRGKSARNVQPEDVTIQSEVEDIEHLREYFQLESVTLLGHSWGALLAMEYALRHPKRISHLILLNAAPVSHDDFVLLGQYRRKRPSADRAKLEALSSTARYEEGDPDTVADYYRAHFGSTLRQPEHLERLMANLRSSFTKEGILLAREIEQGLHNETWLSDEYNLLPKLRKLAIPILIIHGEYDHIPVECVVHIAETIPGAHFVLLKDCGHFSYLECPDQVRKEIVDFFQIDNSHA